MADTGAGAQPRIAQGCKVVNSTLGRYVRIATGTRLLNCEIGDYSYTDRFCDLANATVGKFASIASFARIGPTDHPMGGPAMHSFHYRSDEFWEDAERDPDFFAHRASRRAAIGHDTWIGHNAIIRPQITVGTGAVVAMAAVVTRDVDPYTIVAGIPARVIRRRQPQPIAERLMALAWWDWDHDRLRAALDDFRKMTAEAFLDRHE